jgi:hypothetical protein
MRLGLEQSGLVRESVKRKLVKVVTQALKKVPDLGVATLRVEERAGTLHLPPVGVWLLLERKKGEVFHQVRQSGPGQGFVGPANTERQDGAAWTGRLDAV